MTKDLNEPQDSDYMDKIHILKTSLMSFLIYSKRSAVGHHIIS